MSLDAYHIKVDGALTQIQGQSPATQQVCYDSKGASAYCSLQIRPAGACFDQTNAACRAAANTVTGWIDVFQNVSNVETYGADLEANYTTHLFSHPFSTRLLSTWQPHYLFAQPGAPTYDFGNVTFPNLVPLQNVPALQLTATVNYDLTDKLSVGVTERWRGAMDLEPSGLGIFPTGAPAFYTTNLNISYQTGKAGNEVYVNVRNVFDKLATPAVGLSGSNGYAQSDDPIGRYATAGIRVRF